MRLVKILLFFYVALHLKLLENKNKKGIKFQEKGGLWWKIMTSIQHSDFIFYISLWI